MGYKTKSMINQRGPGQLPGFDIGNLNSLQDIIKKESSKSSSATKAVPSSAINASNLLKDNLKNESSKVSSPTKTKKKLVEGGKFKRSERKEVREAGKEAVKNTELKFKKATLMGGDYFSLMAATAENLANRSVAKRKIKKAAKDLKREILSEGKDIKPIESKAYQELKTTKPNPSSSEEKVKVPKKTDDFKTLPITPDDPSIISEIDNKKVFKKQVETMYGNGPTAPTSNPVDMNKSFGQQVYKDFEKMGEDAKKVLTRGASEKMEKKQRAYNTLGMFDEARKVGSDFTEERKKAEQIIKNTPKSENNFDADLKRQRSEVSKEKERESLNEKEEAKRTLGLQMVGDGFNKGMLRKNKYKK